MSNSFAFKGVRQGDAEALKWNRKVAEQGATKINLGGMYRRGQGVPQDFAEAVKWYLRLAAYHDRLRSPCMVPRVL